MDIELTSPLDMHLHLRDHDMMRLVAPLSAESFAGGVIMPNLVPPVDTLQAVIEYRRKITEACKGHSFTPLMTLFFRDYREEELLAAKECIFGIKLYPAGATTNSEKGVKSLAEAERTFRLMEEMNIPLLVHGESHGFVMDREEDFLPVYANLAEKFPQLKISMEHITTAAAVELLDRYENLYATVTLQHLLITLDDVIGGLMKPHLFCKPIAKRPEDREALLNAVLTGHPKVMFGSDSAPHPVDKKESCGCAAGVFTAPIALPMLAEIFEKHKALDKLQNFISANAMKNYDVEVTGKNVKLTNKPMSVPGVYEGYGCSVVPMNSGGQIGWSFA